MGNKSYGKRSMNIAVRINDPIWLGNEARRMSKELLHKEHRGPGDTIEAAAYRLQTKHGVDASVILQGWQRSRATGWFRAGCPCFRRTAKHSARAPLKPTRKSGMKWIWKGIRSWCGLLILSLAERKPKRRNDK